MPFTTEQFFEVFASYNRAIWPVQIAAYLLAVAVPLALLVRRPLRSRAPLLALAAFWLWNGVAYHALHFSAINPAAYLFGAAFALEGILLARAGARAPIELALGRDLRTLVGLTLLGYAGLVYPLIGHLGGHGYPRAPLLGVTPCPTTIYTIGLLTLARSAGAPLLAIPLLWALFGTSAAVLLAVPEDLGLLVAAVAWLLVRLRERRIERSTTPTPRSAPL